MEVTDIQGQPDKEHPAWTYARWFAVWLAIYVGVVFYGGMLTSAPETIPAGMTWQNPSGSLFSTFFVLRDGQHLMLERNLHSQLLWCALLVMLAAAALYVLAQAVQGKLKNRQGDLFPGWGQALMALAMVAAVVLDLGLTVGLVLKPHTVDFDPVADSVMLDGTRIGAFKDIAAFRYSFNSTSRGATHYSLTLNWVNGTRTQIGGIDAHNDMLQMADYLNGYLAEVRHQK